MVELIVASRRAPFAEVIVHLFGLTALC